MKMPSIARPDAAPLVQLEVHERDDEGAAEDDQREHEQRPAEEGRPPAEAGRPVDRVLE